VKRSALSATYRAPITVNPQNQWKTRQLLAIQHFTNSNQIADELWSFLYTGSSKNLIEQPGLVIERQEESLSSSSENLVEQPIQFVILSAAKNPRR
jgi:hypothetical protein